MNEAIERLASTGVALSFARIAREAGVSQGLVHTPKLKATIHAAIEYQRVHGMKSSDSLSPVRSSVTPSSLKADLALARAEISDLRRIQRELHERLQRSLGAELHSLDQQDALGRIDELEDSNRSLLARHDQLLEELRLQKSARAELEDEISSLRSAYGKLMKRLNNG